MLTMLMVNIAEAKAKLSEYVEAAARGERILICNRNKPVAELRAVEQAPAEPRDLTPMYPGHTFLTAAFLEPLPEEELREWHDNPVFPAARPAKVAEPRAAYGTSSGATRKKRRK
jgi:prevent-host-death family protein